MKPLIITTGEPAGIGPDISLALHETAYPVILLGDIDVLSSRAKQLNLSITFKPYQENETPVFTRGVLHVLSIKCPYAVKAGVLNVNNASYVVAMLTRALSGTLNGEFSGIVTAPVHKAIINQAGLPFTGHTEFFSERCHTPLVVMMLACSLMRVALVTTHLPLREVADAITQPLLFEVIKIVSQALINDFGIHSPKIRVAGLNPHAGESGYLGREEIDIISPVLKIHQSQGIDVTGPHPADTLFTPGYLINTDTFIVMYHDQGLPVLKYADFNQAVNVTLGLPIIRTSVDHGTALELAGTGKAMSGSLIAAVNMALSMTKQRII